MSENFIIPPGKALYTPSPEAREKIKKNCDGCRRSQESKVTFRGPLPIRWSRGRDTIKVDAL